MPQEQHFTGSDPHFIAPFEVVIHNQPTDCWISFLGKVLNITSLIKKHEGERCIEPLLAHAGKDLSHWFDERDGDIRHYIHPVTGANVPYCPFGLIPDVDVQVPSVNWRPLERKPWWKDAKYEVGLLTKRVRTLRVINMLIGKETYLSVCCEDTFKRIMERYSIFNSDADSYTWMYDRKNLNMNKNMEDNGIIDERDTLAELGLPPNLYIPAVFLYYNDDLKWEAQDCNL